MVVLITIYLALKEFFMKNSTLFVLLAILAMGSIHAGIDQVPWYYVLYKQTKGLFSARTPHHYNHYIHGGFAGASVLAGIFGCALLKSTWNEYNNKNTDSDSKGSAHCSRPELQKALLGLGYLGLAGLMLWQSPKKTVVNPHFDY